MSDKNKKSAYVSPYLLQPLRTLAEVSAEVARKTVENVPLLKERDEPDGRVQGDCDQGNG